MSAIVEPLLANVVLLSGFWLYCLWRQNVSLIDLVWPLLFALAAWIWFEPASAATEHWIVLILVMMWSARLHIYLAIRNLGEGEDRRYQAMRKKHAPGFWWKSYFLVFLLQGVLGWVVSLAIYGAFKSNPPMFVWLPALCLALFGLAFETVADFQLARFKSRPENQGKVMDRGLWGYSRHPNYFGECCFWWGIGLMVLPQHYWALISPLVITLLLLKVSGVTLLERDISERRPAYRRYIRRTPAFLPGFRKQEGGA